jgi:hypothetical protein
MRSRVHQRRGNGGKVKEPGYPGAYGFDESGEVASCPFRLTVAWRTMSLLSFLQQ